MEEKVLIFLLRKMIKAQQLIAATQAITILLIAILLTKELFNG